MLSLPIRPDQRNKPSYRSFLGIEAARPQSTIVRERGRALIIDACRGRRDTPSVGFGQATFTGTHGNERGAPIPDLPGPPGPLAADAPRDTSRTWLNVRCGGQAHRKLISVCA